VAVRSLVGRAVAVLHTPGKTREAQGQHRMANHSPCRVLGEPVPLTSSSHVILLAQRAGILRVYNFRRWRP
jgi:hypothetical protein